MKSTLFFAITVFSSIIGVLGTPTPGTTKATTYPTPPGFKPYDVENSVDASQKPSTSTNNFEAAAATQYWVCEAVSSSTGYYGWSQGGSESSALQAAKQKCGKSDCDSYACVEEGCVGLDFGSHSFSLSYATGYGGSDGSEADSKALSLCNKQDSQCAKPGHFCSKYIR